MSTRTRLQKAFALALVAASSGCSSAGENLGGSLDLDVCEGDKWVAVHGLSPAKPVDYVALRQSFGGAGTDSVVDEAGTLCLGAADRAACETAMRTLHASGWSVGSGESFVTNYLAVTVEDDRVVYGSVADLLKFLGPIDTANEAALVASTTGQQILCQSHNARKRDGGFEILTRTGTGCGTGDDVRTNLVLVTTEGKVSVLSSVVTKVGDSSCAIGRRPEGLGPCPTGGDGLGDLLARIARLEAASVPAFARLTRELRAHRAPRSLVERSQRARRDEIRHARVMARLANRYGGRVAPARIEHMPIRALEEVALDNAVEGCVRETYGALVATFQARNAADAEIAEAMTAIAADETEHAALSWDLAAWSLEKLDEAERARIEAAMARAIATLEVELEIEPSADAIALAGFPTRAQGKAMLSSLMRSLA